MRNLVYKLLPYAVGTIFGLLLTFPPAWLIALGPWRYLILAAMVGVGMLGFVGFQMAIGYRDDIAVEPLAQADTTPPAVAALLESYRALGFELVDSPVRVHMRPPAQLWMLSNRELYCWGSIFATGHIQQAIGYDFYSTLEGECGDLTSGANWMAGTMPLDARDFKQILNGAPPAQLLAFHREAQQMLAARGVRFAPPRLPAGGIREILRKSNASKRRLIASNPLKAAVLVLWRVMNKTSPYLGSITTQKTTEVKLRRLLAGA
jgi:hypothetical protein